MRSKNAYDEYTYWNKRRCPTTRGMSSETTQKHIDYIKKHVVGAKKVLDFGPGLGRTFEAYLGVKFVQGVDISLLYDKQVRDVAKALGINFDLRFITGNDLPYTDAEFDVAVASSVLLHKQPQNILEIMKELVRIAKKVVVISWQVDNMAFDKPGVPKPGPDYQFHYSYPDICKTNGWMMEDISRIEDSICFVYTRDK